MNWVYLFHPISSLPVVVPQLLSYVVSCIYSAPTRVMSQNQKIAAVLANLGRAGKSDGPTVKQSLCFILLQNHQW